MSERIIDINWLSPVEKIGDIWIKREDKFTPFLSFLGSRSNGSKLRVCVWLIEEAMAAGAKGVIHGAVTGSPQHVFVATICRWYGIPCIDIVGTSDIDNHQNLKLAKDMGATFVISPVGYAKTLEAKAYEYQRDHHPDYFVLETNITVNEDRNSPKRIKDFHSVGAWQAKNIPKHIETIILPAGSCNSAVGALYGITQYKLPNIKTVILLGIGNYGSKDPDFIRRRLNLIGAPDVFNWPSWGQGSSLPFDYGGWGNIEVLHYDLNGSGFCQYSDLMPYNYHGLELHPRYEGKCFTYMAAHPEIFSQYMNDRTCYWVVGGPVS